MNYELKLVVTPVPFRFTPPNNNVRGLTAFIPLPPKKNGVYGRRFCTQTGMSQMEGPGVGGGIQAFKPPHIVIGGVKRKSTVTPFLSPNSIAHL